MKLRIKKITTLFAILFYSQLSFGEDFPTKISSNEVLTNKTYPISIYLNSSATDMQLSGKGTKINWSDEEKGIFPNKTKPIFKNGADKVYGLDVIPSVSKQSFDLFRNSNQFILDYFIDDPKELKVKETLYSIGIDYSYTGNTGYDNVSGYKTDQSGVYFGIKHKVYNNLDLGGILAVVQSNSNFDGSDSSRDDVNFQGNIYLDYKNDENLRYTSMLFWGKINSDLERSYTAILHDDYNSDKVISQTNNSNMDNYYFGINNRITKFYNVDIFSTNFYYKPKFEFNFVYFMQDSIDESSDSTNYNDSNINSELSLGKEDSYSLNSSVGISVGKDFIFKNNKKLNLELSGNLFLEFGEPYSELTNSSNFNDRVPIDIRGDQSGPATGRNNTIDGYSFDTIFYVISLTGRYEFNKAFSLYSSLNSILGETEDNFQGNIGINYHF